MAPELEFKILSLGGATKLSYSCILEGDFRVMEMMFKVCLCVCVCKTDRDREMGVGWGGGEQRTTRSRCTLSVKSARFLHSHEIFSPTPHRILQAP